MSTLYGSDAMGGIINIITKKVVSEWNGNVSVEQNIQENSDIGNNWKTSAVINGPVIQDKLGIQVRGEFFPPRSIKSDLLHPQKLLMVRSSRS